jgi:nucleotide-binding universal stress UspA family protein
MSFKTIIVHCDASEKLPARLSVAVDVAGRFDARLVGLHVRPPFQPPVVFDSGFAVAVDAFFKTYQETTDADATRASDKFAQAVRGKKGTFEWRVTDGEVAAEIVAQFRYADLLILGQSESAAPESTPPDLPQYVALASGRPLLALPYTGVEKPPGGKVLMCWNESREAARAAADALPFLKTASHVAALIVEPGKRETEGGSRSAANLETWLGRHGVTASVHRDVGADGDVGNVILSRAADLEADLIVMGLYGHSRAREFVLGGASRTILSSMTVPVLMAH